MTPNIRKNHNWLARLAGISLLLLPSLGAAQDLAPPQQLIKSISDQLLVILRTERHRLETDRAYVYALAQDLLLPHIDFDRVSALVLGRYWRTATEQQRQEFSDQFRKLLVNTYTTAVHELSEWEIRYLPLRSQPEDNDITVRTQIMRPGGHPAAVDYRMHRDGDQWLVYDVSIEGVSLVTSYRGSFATLIKRNGMEDLIRRIAQLNGKRLGAGPPGGPTTSTLD